MAATRERMLIGGEWVEAESRETFESRDPATGEVVAVVPRGRAADVERAVAAARRAFEGRAWRETTPAERGRILSRIAAGIRSRADELARLETLDTGKPLRQARTDVEVAARYFEFYAGAADKILGQVIPLGEGFLDYTLREPWGVCAQIIPWNYPIQIGARGIAPALAAGNTVVTKPAEETPLTALRLGAIALEAGLPPGVLNVVTGFGEEAGAPLASHPDVDHVAFTGSVEVGSLVMQAAARNIKPVTLELGGKSPNIVFADADPQAAVPVIVNSIIQNAGQTCSAGSRLLVERAIRDEWVERVAARMRDVRIGPGLEDPDLGPVISEGQLGRVMGYLDVARKEGAEIVTGGGRPSDPRLATGHFVQPTLVDRVKPDMRIAREEVFGPVLAVLPFDDVEEAAAVANSTEYGLVAAIWTRDVSKAHRLAHRLKVGQVYVNTYGAGGGVELPFGGYKKSGFGREKGLEALLTFTQVKNVCVKL
ncbi:MAG TPA: aldehyde dehydrogenase family protein [Thermodesulfobacteriota bacterium]